MNLLTYAKILSRKIKYYDKVAPKVFDAPYFSNPFAKQAKLTVIWVEPCESDFNDFKRFFR